MTNELEQRVAIVTGGGGGIGRAICRRFAGAGALVGVLDRDLAAAEECAAELDESGARSLALEADVADLASHESLLAQVEKQLGPVDVLVNNAGIGRHARMLDVTAEDWDALQAVNTRGAFFLMQAVAKRMVAANRPGSIINVTSVAAEIVWLQNTAYAASKAALKATTEYAAAELGPFGIRVNVLCPGPTDTPLSAPRYQDPEFRKGLLEVLPLRRVGTPEDLANAALFLASDASAFTTGSVIFVDGGRRVG